MRLKASPALKGLNKYVAISIHQVGGRGSGTQLQVGEKIIFLRYE